MQHLLNLIMKGHVLIKDDLGNIFVDKHNAIHPQNMAHIFSRALSNQQNFSVYRMAFGNGGTKTDAASRVIFNNVNDGQTPDARTWDSRLYKETYSEIVDDSSGALLGTDPGSADASGSRAGGGAVSSKDSTSVEHASGPGVHSNELGITSTVVITCELNADEPTGQYSGTDTTTANKGAFLFDEIGLYTKGAPAIDSVGTADVNVGDKNASEVTGLTSNTQYSFNIEIDGSGTIIPITFTTPAKGTGSNGEILYGDLCQALNTGDVNWNSQWGGTSPFGVINQTTRKATISITNTTNKFNTIEDANTYGFLRFTSNSTGVSSKIRLTEGTIGRSLFVALNGDNSIQSPVDGVNAGVQNDPANPTRERERLLSHIIFSPVLKKRGRKFTITYTLTISVTRTE